MGWGQGDEESKEGCDGDREQWDGERKIRRIPGSNGMRPRRSGGVQGVRMGNDGMSQRDKEEPWECWDQDMEQWDDDAEIKRSPGAVGWS